MHRGPKNHSLIFILESYTTGTLLSVTSDFIRKSRKFSTLYVKIAFLANFDFFSVCYLNVSVCQCYECYYRLAPIRWLQVRLEECGSIQFGQYLVTWSLNHLGIFVAIYCRSSAWSRREKHPLKDEIAMIQLLFKSFAVGTAVVISLVIFDRRKWLPLWCAKRLSQDNRYMEST